MCLKKSLPIVSTLCIILFVSLSFAEKTFFAFVPDRFFREEGPPKNIVREFSTPDVNREYTLMVHNKSARGAAPSVIIKLNGSQIIGADAFYGQGGNVSAKVKLLPINKLEVEMRSEIGTSVIVRIVGTGDDPTSPGYPVKGVTIRPGGGFAVNTPNEVIITYEMMYDYDKPHPVVELIRVNEKGAYISTEGVMLDNGNLSNGDEIMGDRVFGFRKTYNVKQKGQIYLQIRSTVDGKTSFSETFNLNVYEPLRKDEINAMLAIDEAGYKLYRELRLSEGEEKAIAATINYFKSQSIVKDAGGGNGSDIWVKYKIGIQSVILLCGPAGTRRECR